MTQHRAIYKSTSIEFLDDFYRQDVNNAVDFGQGVLADPRSDALAVAESWAASVRLRRRTELEGFQARWLDEDSALERPRRRPRPAARVPRRAGARRLATTPVAAIETFWVRGAGDEFEVHIHDGVERITMFMFLPVVRRYGSRRATTRSFVVRVGDLDDVRPERRARARRRPATRCDDPGQRPAPEPGSPTRRQPARRTSASCRAGAPSRGRSASRDHAVEQPPARASAAGVAAAQQRPRVPVARARHERVRAHPGLEREGTVERGVGVGEAAAQRVEHAEVAVGGAGAARARARR